MVAYDYEARRWVEGPAAARLLAEQKAESLELERDPAYLAFIAKKCSECDGPHDSNDCDGITCAECRESYENGPGTPCMQCEMEGMAD